VRLVAGLVVVLAAIGAGAALEAWLGPVGLAVVVVLGGTVATLATIAARPTWRARFDPRSPLDHGERGLALKSSPPLFLRPRPPRH
jgi:hypothetical protein